MGIYSNLYFKAQISFSKSEFYINWILIYCKMNSTVSHYRTKDMFPKAPSLYASGSLATSIRLRALGPISCVDFCFCKGWGPYFGLWASSSLREHVRVSQRMWTFKPVGRVLRFQSEQSSWIEFLIQARKL